MPQLKARLSLNWLWFVLAGVLFILITVVVFYWLDFSKNEVLPLAPVDSVLYVQAKQSFWPWQKTEITELPFDNFYNQADAVLNWQPIKLRQDILPAVNQAAFLLLPNQDTQQFDWVFIFRLKSHLPFSKGIDNRPTVEQLIKSQPNYFQAQKDVFVVASSAQALETVKEVRGGTVFSLASQVKANWLNDGFLNLYFSPVQLRSYLNQDNLLAKIFKSSFEDDVYLILDRAKDNWRFKVINSQADIETSQLITQYLPANFSIFFGGVNLLNIFSAWGQVDQSLADSFDQVSNSFAMIYQFDLQQEIYDLFDQAGDLVIFSFEDQNRSVFDFVFIVPKDSSVNLENLEKLIKIVLAQESPAKVEYLLSDGTTVTEIKADPAAFEWQSKTINNQLEIRYLQQPELGFEIAYLVSGGNILLSSKIDLIQQTINSQDILLRDLVFGCGLKQGSEIMVFNKDKALIFPFLHYLPGDIILITKDSNYLLGCVLDK